MNTSFKNSPCHHFKEDSNTHKKQNKHLYLNLGSRIPSIKIFRNITIKGNLNRAWKFKLVKSSERVLKFSEAYLDEV
jgi:hypothetical protein